MDITLYHMQRTRSFRPRWLLEELQLPYRLKMIDLFAGEGRCPEYLRINPLGALPAVEIDGQVMTESGAICHWLTDRFPEDKLAPAPDSPQRMQYERWMFFAPGTMEPPPFLTLLHGAILPEAERVPEILPWARRAYQPILAMLEQEMTGKDYLLGEHFSTADIMVGSTLTWQPELLEPFPNLQAYSRRLEDRPAYQRASEDPAARPQAAQA